MKLRNQVVLQKEPTEVMGLVHLYGKDEQTEDLVSYDACTGTN